MTISFRYWGLLLVFCTAALALSAQVTSVTVSGQVVDSISQAAVTYTNVVLLAESDSTFQAGTIADSAGRFVVENVKPGNYLLRISTLGYRPFSQQLFVGKLSPFLDLGPLRLVEAGMQLGDVVITGRQDDVSARMDKKSYSMSENVNQAGGSVLNAVQNLPGVTVQDGKVLLRGNDRVTVLIDGKQTALTGFGNQSGLDNLPASSIERIEIITNPNAKFDANGNAGIINIILKKEKKEGLTGKVQFAAGLGALWIRRENLQSIRPQYQRTPKLNPSIALNYRKGKINLFLQADDLYTQTLNKNEFVTRTYDDGTVITQQLKRNRNTNFLNAKTGLDVTLNAQNTLSISGLYGSEVIIDRGDEPFFDGATDTRLRLWQFLEDEVKTTVMATAAFQHKFSQPGHQLSAGFNYTFHREDEKYFFDNTLPTTFSQDAFALISDEHVADLNLDYVRPLKYGRIEAGAKFRRRVIPTDMLFIPGAYSALDTNAGGWATYKETIPAVYGNYVLETQHWEAELGLRAEYVRLRYEVNPNHPTYASDGYDYAQPFPNLRLAYKLNENHKLSAFYNRRVDRPNEVDIRIFPKYDDAEIIKVGNPGLQPQFTQSVELGYRATAAQGYLYAAAYHRWAEGTITRISTTVPGSNLIYAIFQNAGRSRTTGIEAIGSRAIGKRATLTLSLNGYRNEIDAFSVLNLYPVAHRFTAARQEMFSGNAKLNGLIHLPAKLDCQFTASYLAPDIIPQGRIGARFSLDLGLKKSLQKGKGEVFLNATDLLNTLVIRKEIQGDGFHYTSTDYYETQVIRLGYGYKF